MRWNHHMRYFITQRNWGGASKSNASSQGGQKSVQGNLDSEFLCFLEDELYAVAAAFFAKYFALFSLFICINIFSSSVRLSFMSVTFPENIKSQNVANIWNHFKPVPMVPPWSLIVKCCPASRTIGFSSLIRLLLFNNILAVFVFVFFWNYLRWIVGFFFN